MPGIEIEPFETIDGFENQGSNQSGMRQRNERLVLTILRQQGALPKAEIARKTGLSAQTVSVIMRALESDGLLKKRDKVRGKVGQPSVPMGLDPEGALFFGLKVGRRSAEILLVDFVGDILARRSLTYKFPTPEATLDFVKTSVSDITGGLEPEQRARLSGLGIAIPYFLWEWASVIGVDPEEMAAWKGFDLRAEVEALFDFPVYLGNDGTSACGAELVFGETEKLSDFLYFYVGYFIGGGVVLNGSLHTGRSGNGGAIGPFPVAGPDGKVNQLVDVASLIGLERRFLDAGGNAEKMWENPTDWGIEAAIIDDWFAEAVPALSNAIVSAISFIDFSAVLIDGSMPTEIKLGLTKAVNRQVDRLNLSGLTRPDIIPGSVGINARALGAASLPLSKRFMLAS